MQRQLATRLQSPASPRRARSSDAERVRRTQSATRYGSGQSPAISRLTTGATSGCSFEQLSASSQVQPTLHPRTASRFISSRRTGDRVVQGAPKPQHSEFSVAGTPEGRRVNRSCSFADTFAGESIVTLMDSLFFAPLAPSWRLVKRLRPTDKRLTDRTCLGWSEFSGGEIGQVNLRASRPTSSPSAPIRCATSPSCASRGS